MASTLVTLGKTEVELKGRPVGITAQEALVLAYVCASPHQRCRRTEVIAVAWPTSGIGRGRHSLSQVLYALRGKGLNEELAVAGDILDASRMRWDVSELIHSSHSGQFSHAAEYYHGPFIPNCDDLSGRARDWRDEIQLNAATQLAKALHELSLTAGASSLSRYFATCEHIAALHPHLNKAMAAAIQFAARIGGESLAEQIYAKYKERTDQLPPLSNFLSFAKKAPKGAVATPFQGRDLELRAMRDSLRTAGSGSGGVILVQGEAGIGKTRLAEQLLRRAALDGFSIWMVGCCAATQRLPYSAARDLFNDNRSSMGHLATPVADAFADLERFNQAKPDELRHRLVEAFTSAVMGIAEKTPIVIFVDDAQWIDEFTCLLLTYWAHRFREKAILLTLAVRTQEAEDDVADRLTAEMGHAVRIELSRLSVDAARDIVASFEKSHGVCLDDEKRDSVLWLSGGRPFLLLEALSASIAEQSDAGAAVVLTASAESTLKRRFKGLSNEASLIADFLCTWGKPASIPMLQIAAGLSGEQTAAAVDTLQRRGILVWADAQVSFVHDLMRETAYRNLLPASRQHLHGRAAELAIARHEPDGFIAEHLLRSQQTVAAVCYALKAAGEAHLAGVESDYEYYLQIAIHHGDSATRNVAACDLAMHMAHGGRIQQSRQLLPCIDISDARGASVAALMELEEALSTNSIAATEMVDRASQLIDFEGNQRVSWPLGILLEVALDAGKPRFATDLLREFSARSTDANERMCLEAYRVIWSVADRGLSSSLSDAQSLTTQLDTSYDHATTAVCLSTCGTLLLLSGQVKEAAGKLSDSLHAAQRAGDVKRQHSIRVNWAVACIESGDYDLAHDLLTKGLSCPAVNIRMRCYANMAILHYETGRDQLALDAADALRAMNAAYSSVTLRNLPDAITNLVLRRSTGVMISSPADTKLEGFGAFEDSSYYMAFAAYAMADSGNRHSAAELLERERGTLRGHNILAAMRLDCVLAEILVGSKTDQAYRLASDVFKLASSNGAITIARAAQRILDQTRLHA